jgi:hypothetical protein
LHSSFRDVLQQTNHENLEVVHATGGPKFPAEPSPGDAVFFVQVSYKSLTDCWYKLYSIHGDYTNQKTINVPKGNQYNQSIVVYIYIAYLYICVCISYLYIYVYICICIISISIYISYLCVYIYIISMCVYIYMYIDVFCFLFVWVWLKLPAKSVWILWYIWNFPLQEFNFRTK